MKSSSAKSTVEGEGDYASARKYNAQAQAFSRSGKVRQAAKEAAPRNPQEQDAMRRAEAEGPSHAKGQAGAAIEASRAGCKDHASTGVLRPPTRSMERHFQQPETSRSSP